MSYFFDDDVPPIQEELLDAVLPAPSGPIAMGNPTNQPVLCGLTRELRTEKGRPELDYKLQVDILGSNE